MEQVLFSLYYCYRKQGENENADRIKGILARDFPASDLTRIAQTGKNPAATQKNAATQTYERIYDLFIEGRFEKALTEKKTADSLYGTSYWTPQLLYIEAVYLVRQRNDSAAIRTLNDLIKQFSDKPLAEKARNLVAVLYRRADIEEELRRMEVTRATDSTRGRTILPVQVKTVRDTTTVKPLPTRDLTQPKPKADTVAVKPIARPEVPSTYTFQPDQPHYVVVVLNKVDPVFVNEARNAFQRYNREAAPGKNLQVDLFQLDTDNRLLLIAPFPTAGDAVLYMDRAKPRTSTEILPWLRGGKYSYLILSDPNFNILKGSADLDAYRKFLDQNLPGKFQ
jgi:hypothetical protein